MDPGRGASSAEASGPERRPELRSQERPEDRPPASDVAQYDALVDIEGMSLLLGRSLDREYQEHQARVRFIVADFARRAREVVHRSRPDPGPPVPIATREPPRASARLSALTQGQAGSWDQTMETLEGYAAQLARAAFGRNHPASAEGQTQARQTSSKDAATIGGNCKGVLSDSGAANGVAKQAGGKRRRSPSPTQRTGSIVAREGLALGD